MNLRFSGNVNIKIYDASHTVISDTTATNTVLDYITPVFNAIIGSINEDDLCSPATTLAAIAKTFVGANALINPSIFGMVAYHNTKAIPSTLSTSHEKPCACASGVTTPTSILGSLNATLSQNLVDSLGNIIGYQFVWDFSAGAEVSNINSICLTTSAIASQKSPVSLSSSIEISNHYDYGSKRRNNTFSKNGAMLSSSDNIVTWRKDKKIRITATGVTFSSSSVDVETILTLPGYSDCFKTIDADSENMYITIAKNLATNNRELLKIDKTSKAIVSAVVLSCLNSLVFYDWGLCGNFVVVLTTTGGTSPVAKAVNTLTNVLTALTLPSNTGSSNGIQTIYTYTTVEGSYCCDIDYSTDNYSPYNPRFVEVYQKADASGVEFTDYNITGSSRDVWKPGQPFGGLPVSWIVDTGYIVGSKVRQYLGIARRALFSICNLEAPVTKSSTQTMQIVYQLYWGAKS